MHAVDIALVGLPGLILALASCPCSSTTLVVEAGKEVFDGPLSGSKLEVTCSISSRSELSESISEEALSVRPVALHSLGCASLERSMHDLFLERSSTTAVLVEGTSLRSCLDPP